MRTITIANLEFGIEFWCPPPDLRGWQFGTERIDGTFPSWHLWLGPLHVVCNRRTASLSTHT